MCDSGNFFGYETRRVGGNTPEDYSILTERHIEKRHKIDMVCGNIEGNVNCTYTFVAGRSISKLIASLLSKTKQRKRRNIKEMTSANNFRALFGLARPKLPFKFNILFKAVAQHGIDGGLIGAILL